MIVLIKGHRVEVDQEDVSIVRGHGWCVLSGHGRDRGLIYFTAQIKGKNVLLHRLIMNAPRGIRIDHADRDTLNNQKRNLRFASQSQNLMNSGRHIDNTSGYKGVSWSQQKQKWQARIMSNRKEMHLGFFVDPSIAHEAYQKVAVRLNGEFARW